MSNRRKNPWTKLSSKLVFENPWYKVKQDRVIKPDGSHGLYNVVESPAAVFSVAVDEEKRVYLVGLHRYATGLYSIEVPSGGSESQSPLKAAKRELQEETGLVASVWKELGIIYPANGFLNQPNYIFLATSLTKTVNNKRAEEGINEVIAIPLTKALNMIQHSEIVDAQSIAAIIMAAMDLGVVSLKSAT